MSGVPLSGLLARTLGDLTAAFVADGAGQHGVPSPAMWFGLLRAIPAAGEVAMGELPERARLSKRAARQVVGAATRNGWVESTGSGVRARLGLSSSGREAAARWERLPEDVERRWSIRVGADHLSLRELLGTVVGQFDLEWPHYPISYGSSDFSVTGGQFRPAQSGPPRVPAHGQDWIPVLRGEGDTVSTLALTALLSQLLTAFMADYEQESWAVVVAAGLVQGFGARDTAPLEEVPPVLGVDGGGRSVLERHGLVSVRSAGKDPAEKVAQLTTRGQHVRDGYDRIVQNVESCWAGRFGASTLAAVRDALEATLPALDPALPDALIATSVRA